MTHKDSFLVIISVNRYEVRKTAPCCLGHFVSSREVNKTYAVKISKIECKDNG